MGFRACEAAISPIRNVHPRPVDVQLALRFVVPALQEPHDPVESLIGDSSGLSHLDFLP
jgi:hypothetical protein